jgi:2TM domain-containing protein
MVTTDEYKQAERELMRHQARRGWKVHLVVYALVNAGLMTLNLALVTTTDASFIWFPFPLVCWGIGLTAHYFCGVRSADREITARQDAVEERAEWMRRAA